MIAPVMTRAASTVADPAQATVPALAVHGVRLMLLDRRLARELKTPPAPGAAQ